MDIINIMTIIAALFFALNIGASATVASMAACFGSKTVKKRTALILAAVFVILGAVLAGKNVTKTISAGIIPQDIITIQVSFAVFLAAGLALFFSNLIKIPLSTSQVTVGALVGAGLFFQKIFAKELIIILVIWTILPFISLALSYLSGKYAYPKILKWLGNLRSIKKVHKVMNILLITSGSYVAFSFGANNTANVIGPLVGAGLVNLKIGNLIGSVFIALGALIFGERVLHTASREITEICTIRAILVSFTAGTLVIIASLLGLPTPLVQLTTVAIIGVGASKCGTAEMSKHKVVRKIIKTWVISPIIALVLAYSIIYLFSIF